MDENLSESLADTCFVFRGYNTTNLGRTPDLLDSPRYGPIVEKWLRRASDVASDETKKHIDLLARVRNREETDLATFADAVALILATEVAQIECLSAYHSVDYASSRLAAGYSLGEIAANICGGVLSFDEALRVPASLAPDCAELGKTTRMGIIFSRTGQLDVEKIERLCVSITMERRGTIAISAILSPNTILILGQNDTVDRFSSLRRETLPSTVHFRMNPECWPPLHTPIVRQHNITDRASARLQSMGGKLSAPVPPIASLVTGKISYNDYNSREILSDWTDHPQLVWDTVCETLSTGIRVIVHVGPEPNLFPATYKRLADNISRQNQTSGTSSLGRRLVSGMVDRPWLAALLPSQANLLRAPSLHHIIREDWLLDNDGWR